MIASGVPAVSQGERDPLVNRVRVALNMNGDDELDQSLAQVIRGIQRTNGLPITGDLDERTLAILGL